MFKLIIINRFNNYLLILIILGLYGCALEVEERVEKWEQSNYGTIAVIDTGAYTDIEPVKNTYDYQNLHVHDDTANIDKQNIPKELSAAGQFVRGVGIGAAGAVLGTLSCAREFMAGGGGGGAGAQYAAGAAAIICLPVGLFYGLAGLFGGVAESIDTLSTDDLNGAESQTVSKNIPIRQEEIESIANNTAQNLQNDYKKQFTYYANTYNPSTFINVIEASDAQKYELINNAKFDGNVINYIIEIGIIGISESNDALILASKYNLFRLPENELIHDITMIYTSDPRSTPVWINNSAEALSYSIKNAYSQFTQKIIYYYFSSIDKYITEQVAINE